MLLRFYADYYIKVGKESLTFLKKININIKEVSLMEKFKSNRLFISFLITFVMICMPAIQAFSQDVTGTDVAVALSNLSVESVEYFKVAVSDKVEDSLYYDVFTTSEFIRYGKKKVYLDVVCLTGYAISAKNRETAKELASKTVFYVNNIENITDEKTLKIKLRTETFKFYNENGELMYGAVAYAKVTEYNTAPVNYISRKNLNALFGNLKAGKIQLTGFGRLLPAYMKKISKNDN